MTVKRWAQRAALGFFSGIGFGIAVVIGSLVFVLMEDSKPRDRKNTGKYENPPFIVSNIIKYEAGSAGVIYHVAVKNISEKMIISMEHGVSLFFENYLVNRCNKSYRHDIAPETETMISIRCIDVDPVIVEKLSAKPYVSSIRYEIAKQ